ncbi:MAG: hypothetical protein K2Q12_07240, partial [Rickettsiales bacterium]|nr:hypothetical protein [Rickettsiales bacterium]
MAAKTGRAALVGLVGHPITHSLSPAIHEFWMAEHSMDAAYIPIRSSEGNLVSLMQALRKLDLRGLNVTVPFK